MNLGIPETEVRKILTLRFVEKLAYSDIVRHVDASYSTVARLCQGKIRAALVARLREELGASEAAA